MIFACFLVAVLFGLYANEALTHVQKEEMDRLVLATEGQVPQALSFLFKDVSKYHLHKLTFHHQRWSSEIITWLTNSAHHILLIILRLELSVGLQSFALLGSLDKKDAKLWSTPILKQYRPRTCLWTCIMSVYTHRLSHCFYSPLARVVRSLCVRNSKSLKEPNH